MLYNLNVLRQHGPYWSVKEVSGFVIRPAGLIHPRKFVIVPVPLIGGDPYPWFLTASRFVNNFDGIPFNITPANFEFFKVTNKIEDALFGRAHISVDARREKELMFFNSMHEDDLAELVPLIDYVDSYNQSYEF